MSDPYQVKTPVKHPRRRKWGRVGAMTLAGLLIFALGVNVGNGRIQGWLHLPGANKQVTTGLPATLDYRSVNDLYQALKQNYDGQSLQ